MSCDFGGSSAPPFGYEDNSRIIIEMVLRDENDAILKNQQVDLMSTSYGKQVIVKTDYSENDGKIFISVPKGNYAYALFFTNKKIISTQNYSNLVVFDQQNTTNTGIIAGFSETYYNFGTVKLINN